ncbi:MAG: hypothetical protein J6B29_05090 [Clostridia bacterium]|nr:hypothetical protein [Clostridia bacterium]
MKLIVEQIVTPSTSTDEDIFDIARARIKKTRALSISGNLYIYKRSIDARHNDSIKLVSSVCAEVERIGDVDLAKHGFKELADDNVEFLSPAQKVSLPPVVVGFGPCGMFCALGLARAGLKPIVIERGADVDTRVKAVNDFCATKKLNTETNIQFGAGGAGTFSDGKLTTGINDPLCSFVLKTLCQYGAPKDIMYKAKPHIGTDLLRNVVKNIACEIERLGGKIYYNTRLLSYDNGVAVTTDGTFGYSSLVLAIGHSARDTYSYLLSKGVAIEPKPFSVGVRVEHLQSEINEAMYGKQAEDPRLGSASYKLSYRENNRGVYSFCMCPGGEVVSAQSEEDSVVVNGMSCYARDGVNANSAIVVQINREDFGCTPTGAIEYQRRLEKLAFAKAGGTYRAPVQTLEDFYNGVAKHEPKRIAPTYMNGFTQVCDLNTVLPKLVCDYLKLGFEKFGRKIKGFNAKDVPLTGVETRTSAPVRIMRTEGMNMLNDKDVYPGGEGAGYAGGIMSASVDGVKIALAILNKKG